MASNLEHTRHTLAHLLAAAVLQHHPDAKRTLGPAIENGFYYDFDFPTPISDTDLEKIEMAMRDLLPSWTAFEHKEVSEKEARALFKDNPYKLEMIAEIAAKGEPITLYACGGFTDLCRGGHVEHPADDIAPDSFKLDKIAGAYWRGNEKNAQLTRIYGLAFASKKDLDAHIAMLEEAKKRDHKIIGPALDLFVFSDLIGSGLPLWTPRGTLVRNLLDSYVWDLRRERGYEQVDIPHITKKELYETSGHWEKFKDDLFKINTREGHVFAMKPMNCPHHTQLYARRPWSYRELPQRYANTTKVYRDEQSGELAGLLRVRAITQDDAHVFCRTSQVREEFQKVWDIVHRFYSTFGFVMRVRLSLHDPAQPEKYLGGTERWSHAEQMLRDIASENDADSFEGIGEANFYGPKLDFLAKDAIGREHQVATIQLDMNLPERFDLTCTNEKGEKERIVMIHAAIMGSIERFLAVLIEHSAGALPTWLAPVQVAVHPISAKHADAAAQIAQQFRNTGIRVEVSTGDETIGKRIRGSEQQKIPYSVVLGDKDIAAGVVSVRARGGEDLGQLTPDDFVRRITVEVAERK